MADSEKVAAVVRYLREQFDSCSITDSMEPGGRSYTFRIETDGLKRTAVVEKAFLDGHAPEAIPGVLGRFLLAEHLRECNFPIVVTPTGLSD